MPLIFSRRQFVQNFLHDEDIHACVAFYISRSDFQNLSITSALKHPSKCGQLPFITDSLLWCPEHGAGQRAGLGRQVRAGLASLHRLRSAGPHPHSEGVAARLRPAVR